MAQPVRRADLGVDFRHARVCRSFRPGTHPTPQRRAAPRVPAPARRASSTRRLGWPAWATPWRGCGRAIRGGETILVHGDYDVDGICSTAHLRARAAAMGARAEPFVPHRLTDGYDLTDAGIARGAAARRLADPDRRLRDRRARGGRAGAGARGST
jgi:hypothetical protein